MRMIALAACPAACTAACGPDADPSPGPTPSDKPFAEVTADGRLRIPEEALGRPLTLTRTLIMAGTNVDQINPMRTQIVHFERSAEGAIEIQRDPRRLRYACRGRPRPRDLPRAERGGRRARHRSR